PSADRVPDGARHPHRASSDCERTTLGNDRRARPGGRRRRRGGRGGCGPLPRRGPVPSVARGPAREGGTVTTGRLQGKVALVVGGGSGMGRAGSAAMAAEGAAVVVSDIAVDRAEAVAASISDAGGVAVAMRVDVTSPELVRQLVADTVSRFGRIDALYHCAA